MNKLMLLVLFLGLSLSSIAQKTVTGRVMDSENESLPGVNIIVKGTNSFGISNLDGYYNINVPDNAVLIFKSIGMKTLEVSVDGRSVLPDVILEADDTEIGEVVVIGFGSQKKESLTGAVATVDTKVLEDRPVSNIAQALQGAVAGVNFSVGNGGGELNNSMGINIRGTGSIGNTSFSPLVLIDGTEGDLNSIAPQDIESISVLKDAASCAVYGSRAAFGVILIKTKSGKEGKITVNYSNNFRLSKPLLQPKMLNSLDFATYFNEAAKNKGAKLPFSSEVMQKIIKYRSGELSEEAEWLGREWSKWTNGFSDRNWFKELYNDAAPAQEHNLSIRGGNEKTNYYLSANYLTQDGLIKYNTDTRDKYSVNAKISSQVNKVVKLGYSGRFTRIDFGRSSFRTNLFYHNVARKWPTLPLKDTNGNYVFQNDISNLNNGRRKEQWDEFVQQLSLVITPIKGWNTHIELNYKTGTKYVGTSILPVYKYDDKGNPIFAPLEDGSKPGFTKISEYSGKWNFFNPNIYTEYFKTINDSHNFKVMAGFQSELNKGRGLYAAREDVYSPSVTAINATYGENDNVRGGYNHWATAGFFGRINYNYKEKYLIEFSGRYDGSSRFLRDKRWNFFPSVSTGWNVANEDFWTGGFLDEISTLKVRASYGELGNQNVVDQWKNPIYYPFYLDMPVQADWGKWLVDGKKTNASWAPNLVSSSLTWERIKSWNIGFDLSMLNNRLNLNFDYFNRKTFDMIGPAPQLPVTLGTNVPKINNTDMESKGFEIEISWRDKLENGFAYGVKLIVTDSKQTITKYPNENGLLDNYYAGEELNEIWGYTSTGIAKTDDEMSEHLNHNNPEWGSKWAAGDMMYQDLNGDGKVNKGANTLKDHGDFTVIGNSTPRYNFGFDFDAQYKGFDIRAFFQGTAKRDLYVGGPYFVGANVGMWQSAAFEEHLDYFRPLDTDSPYGPNVDSYYPRPLFEQGGKNFERQTKFLQNAAYVRLKSLQFGYTVPVNATASVGIKKMRVYVSFENLFTITKMTKIFDPETTGGGWGNGKIYPLSKVYSCGFSLTF